MGRIWKCGLIVLAVAVILSEANAQTSSCLTEESPAPANNLSSGCTSCSSPTACWGNACSAGSVSGLFAYAEGLAWRARRQGLDHTAFLNPVWLTPVQVESLEGDWSGGVRVGVGYRFDTAWEASWNYTYYQTSDAASKQASDYPTLAMTATRSFLDHTIDTMEAQADLNYQINDFIVSRNVRLDSVASLHLLGGFRWAKIDQNHDQRYTYRDLFDQTVWGTIADSTSLDAYGIRIGGELHWGRDYGPSLFCRASGSVLAGHFKTTQREIDQVDGSIIDFTDNSLRPVPVLETALGIAWRTELLEIAAGYELNAWFNMAQVDRANYDLLLDGIFLRLALTR